MVGVRMDIMNPFFVSFSTQASHSSSQSPISSNPKNHGLCEFGNGYTIDLLFYGSREDTQTRGEKKKKLADTSSGYTPIIQHPNISN